MFARKQMAEMFAAMPNTACVQVSIAKSGMRNEAIIGAGVAVLVHRLQGSKHDVVAMSLQLLSGSEFVQRFCTVPRGTVQIRASDSEH